MYQKKEFWLCSRLHFFLMGCWDNDKTNILTTHIKWLTIVCKITKIIRHQMQGDEDENNERNTFQVEIKCKSNFSSKPNKGCVVYLSNFYLLSLSPKTNTFLKTNWESSLFLRYQIEYSLLFYFKKLQLQNSLGFGDPFIILLLCTRA